MNGARLDTHGGGQASVPGVATYRVVDVSEQPLAPAGQQARVLSLPLITDPAIALDRVTLRYPGTTEPAVCDLSLQLGAGRTLALIGHNGSGKSTLLRCLAGLLVPESGSVHCFGVSPDRCRRRIALLPQRSGIAWDFPITVRRFVLGGRAAHLGWWRRTGAADRERAVRALHLLRLESLQSRRIDELSGGQQQRLLLARALVQEADLLLLDEPLNAIDAETRAILAEVLTAQRTAGCTIVVATHDLGPGRGFYDEVVALHEGRRIEVPEDRLAQLCQSAGCAGVHG